MYDNKIRLSQDVLEKAERIAAEWGLKNARAAVEAVFRRYSDDYLHGREPSTPPHPSISMSAPGQYERQSNIHSYSDCEALNELDDLLSL